MTWKFYHLKNFQCLQFSDVFCVILKEFPKMHMKVISSQRFMQSFYMPSPCDVKMKIYLLWQSSLLKLCGLFSEFIFSNVIIIPFRRDSISNVLPCFGNLKLDTIRGSHSVQRGVKALRKWAFSLKQNSGRAAACPDGLDIGHVQIFALLNILVTQDAPSKKPLIQDAIYPQVHMAF